MFFCIYNRLRDIYNIYIIRNSEYLASFIVSNLPEIFPKECEIGNISFIKKVLKQFPDFDTSDGLRSSVLTRNGEVVELLLKERKYPKELLNQMLELSCKINSLTMAELFVKAGADIKIGIVYTNSPNILRMLHRYNQGSELIN